MKYRYFSFFVIILYSCGTSAPNPTASNANGSPDKNKLSPLQETAAKKIALSQFNDLERFFGNENYLIDRGNDTSFLYFSRISDFLILTHQYVLRNGDSTFLKIDSIRLDPEMRAVWKWKQNKLLLRSADNNSVDWANTLDDQLYLQFQKTDNDKIKLAENGQTNVVLQKTLTISKFLVRSFYDHNHGTRLAYDSSEFTKTHK
ncbi:MAG: hypothetical protein ABIX01_08970 [Chitinophagaceae bacterium]